MKRRLLVRAACSRGFFEERASNGPLLSKISLRYARNKPRTGLVNDSYVGILLLHSSSRFFSSQQSEKVHLSSRIQEIFQCPVGSLERQFGWNNVETTIREASRSQQNAELLYQLLDRLVAEVDQASEGPSSIGEDGLQRLLSSTVYHWRKEYLQAQDRSSVFIQPSELAQTIHLWDQKCGSGFIQCDTSIYTMILEAACSNTTDDREGVAYADSLLEWMVEQAQENQNFKVQPSIYSVGIVMQGWAGSSNKHNSISHACERIENWLRRAQELHDEGWLNLRPNTVVYNIYLHALAEAKNVQRAEQVLQGLLDRRWGVEPDPISFSTVLLAYTRKETIEAMVKAETLLGQMKELYHSGMDSAKPTLLAFSTVIQGFAQLGQPQPAEDLLSELYEEYSQTMDADLEPDITVYNSVIAAWSNAGQPDRAEELLSTLVDKCIVEPNERSFHAVLSGWAKLGQPGEAESLLYRMHELYTDHAHASSPSTMTYNIVLDAWAKSRRNDAWERALAILQHMEELHQSGDVNVQPNVHSLNTVLNCFRNAGQGNFHGAFKVLDRFIDGHEEGRVDAVPNLITWNTLLAGCAKNTRDDFRVLQIWERMAKFQCEPDIISYTMTFACYARYGAISAKSAKSLLKFARRFKSDKLVQPSRFAYLRLVEAWVAMARVDLAEETLIEVCNAGPRQGSPIVDREVFHRVMKGWSQLNKARRVESLFLFMNDIHERWELDEVKPSQDTYNILLHSWAKSGEKQSGERAEYLLRQMARRGAAPDRTSYNIVLNAWAESCDLIACSKIEALVLEMILCGNEDKLPDDVSYNTWMKAILNDSKEQNKGRRVTQLLEMMEIQKFEPSDYIVQQAAILLGKVNLK